MVIGSKSIESKKNHLLQENDVFKVGRMAFKILQVQNNKKNTNNLFI